MNILKEIKIRPPLSIERLKIGEIYKMNENWLDIDIPIIFGEIKFLGIDKEYLFLMLEEAMDNGIEDMSIEDYKDPNFDNLGCVLHIDKEEVKALIREKELDYKD